jgi:hypothetical protein
VILDEHRKPRAQRFVAVIDAALEAWGARWPLYLALAFICVAVQLAVVWIARFDPLTTVIANCVVDGFATAFYTISIAAHRQETRASIAEVARAALARWPVVTFVLVGVQVVVWAFSPWIFGSPEDMYYGIGILPTLIVFGMMGIATVIASLDISRSLFLQPGFAFLRSVVFARSWANVWRLGIAGAIVVIPMMLQQMLEQYLAHHGIAIAQNTFLSNIPVDALVLGPTQAFFTYLYMDFLTREP